MGLVVMTATSYVMYRPSCSRTLCLLSTLGTVFALLALLGDRLRQQQQECQGVRLLLTSSGSSVQYFRWRSWVPRASCFVLESSSARNARSNSLVLPLCSLPTHKGPSELQKGHREVTRMGQPLTVICSLLPGFWQRTLHGPSTPRVPCNLPSQNKTRRPA